MDTIEQFQNLPEGQVFDRKSIRIQPKSLAVTLIAFANADGGQVLLGMGDHCEIEGIQGIQGQEEHLNKLLVVPTEFCKPAVKVKTKRVPCKDQYGKSNYVLLIDVPRSDRVHANQADEVFYRVGDKSKKLSFDERLQLIYDKGEMYYEDTFVPNAGLNDLDMRFVSKYLAKIGYAKDPTSYLLENKNFIKKSGRTYKISVAALLLFGKKPQNFLPRARLRFIRYQGTEEKTGAEMNVVKDVVFEGNVLDMIRKSLAYLKTQIKEPTWLAKDGRFVTMAEYPDFVRQELIVNAVAHRAYSIGGTDTQIKMFDDRLVVESPGRLPGLVEINNMRHIHFSRNPKIAAFLISYKYVKEFGEGVDRMCREMEGVGLPIPVYKTIEFMLQATVYNRPVASEKMAADQVSQDATRSEVEKARNGGKAGIEIGVETGIEIGVETGVENRAEKARKKHKSDVEAGVETGVETGVENQSEKARKRRTAGSGNFTSFSDTQHLIMALIGQNNRITQKSMSEKTGLALSTIANNIKTLKERNILAREGATKKGYWVILSQTGSPQGK